MQQLLLVTASFLGLASGQATYVVDVTNASLKERIHEPSSTTGGVAGLAGGTSGVLPRKDGLELKLLGVTNISGVSGPGPIVDVLLSNRGTEAIGIPVDPSSAEIEPVPFRTPYSFRSAFILLSSDGMGSGLGTLTLYGSSTADGSLRSLGPGQSIEIRGHISPEPNIRHSTVVESQIHLKAGFWIDDNVVTQQGANLHQGLQESFPPLISANEVVIAPTA